MNFFFPDPPQPSVITNNRVSCENPNADGILLFGYGNGIDHSLILNNRVEMAGSVFGAISLVEDVSGTVVAFNQVRGAGAYALDVLAFDLPSQGNVLVGNDTTGFEPSFAHVWLDPLSEDTWVIGCQGTVLDESTSSHVVGCPSTPAPAARVRGGNAPSRGLQSLTRAGQCPGVAAANPRLAAAAGCAP